MTSRTAAARYVRALLDVAIKESVDLDRIARELDEFVGLLKQQPAVERVMLNPAVPAPRKRAAMEEIVKLTGFAPVVSKLLVLLADRDRLALLTEISAAYHERLAERQNVIRAEITTAEPLSSDRAAALEQTLANVTGKRVTMKTTVNPELIGGVIARVGSTVYDASVVTQLRKIRERLTT
jgi:F-type H+-transporting ATPase subunit delta